MTRSPKCPCVTETSRNPNRTDERADPACELCAGDGTMTRACIRCRREIPAKRLAAVPNATRCVGCQQRCDLDPAEVFGTRLERVMVVGAEGDGDHFRVGGDCHV